MRSFFTPILFIFLLLPFSSFAQDVIITNDAKIIKATIERMDESGVFFRSNVLGLDSLHHISANKIKTIRLKNERSIEETPDFFVILKIDEWYNTLLSSQSVQKKDRAKSDIVSYYSHLDGTREERIRNRLLSRIIKANDAHADSLLWYIEEYMLATPFDKPGRGPLYGLLAQFYETSMDLDALESVKEEIIQYEHATGKRYSNAKSKVILSIARVKKAQKMGEELVGFWVSDICDDDSKCPYFFLYIEMSPGDSLAVHLCTTVDIGAFEKIDKPISAQRILLNGIKNEYGFTFATDKIEGGNQILAHGVVAFGSSLASTAAERATLKSGDTNYRPVYTGSLIMSLTQVAAIALAKSRKNIEVIDFYGERLYPDILSSHFLYVCNKITAGEAEADSVLEKDTELTFYRVYPEDHICFFDESGILRGVDTEHWTQKEQSDWWKLFWGSQDFLDLQKDTEEPISNHSKRQVIKAYNKRSYKELSKFYGTQIY